MPRCTPQVIVDDEQRAILEAAKQNSTPGSDRYKRSVTILESADGTSAAQIAAQYGVSRGSIQKYRTLFRSGGCEALLSFKQNKGRCGKNGTLAIDRVRAEVDRRIVAGLIWTAVILAIVLKLALSTVKKCLRVIRQERGIAPKNRGPARSREFTVFNGFDLELVGFYLDSSHKIIALSVYPTHDDQRTKGRRIRCIDSSGTETEQSMAVAYKNQTLGLALNSLLSNVAPQGTPLKVADFAHSLQKDLEQQGAKLALIACGDITEDLLQGDGITCIHAESLDAFTKYLSEAIRTIDNGVHASSAFQAAFKRCIKQNAENRIPITWRAFMGTPAVRGELCVHSSAQTYTTITFETVDKDGNTLLIRREFPDIFPRFAEIQGCKTVHEFQNYAGRMEQGITQIMTDVASNFLQRLISLGSLRKPSKLACESSQTDTKAKSASPHMRIFEMESTLGRIRVPAPLTLDATGIPSRARLWTPMIKTLVIEMAQVLPYRKVAWYLNIALHRDAATQLNYRTIDACIRRWGQDVSNQVKRAAEEALRAHNFDPETGKPAEGVRLPNFITHAEISEEELECERAGAKAILDKYRAEHPDFPDIADPHKYITADPAAELLLMSDGVWKRTQTSHRREGNEPRKEDGESEQKQKSTWVNTETANMRWAGGSYVIAAETSREALLIALGLILKYRLLEGRRLTTFSDGASEILTNLREIFGFHKELRVFLDWYHVSKRLRCLFSQALYPGTENHEQNQEAINDVLSLLWFGRVEDAKKTIIETPKELIRNQDKIDAAYAYVQKHEAELYCYVLRQIAQVTNSSNRSEQVNKTLVSYRQKHRGMSWSKVGSHALAVLKALMENGHLREWIETGIVPFRPKVEHALTEQAAS